MLEFKIHVYNPWSDYFKTGVWWSEKLIGNKFWELQLMRTRDIISIHVEMTHRRDHAGLRIELGLFSFNAIFSIYDRRHWNHITNKWGDIDG